MSFEAFKTDFNQIWFVAFDAQTKVNMQKRFDLIEVHKSPHNISFDLFKKWFDLN